MNIKKTTNWYELKRTRVALVRCVRCFFFHTSAQRTQRNINSVVSESSVVDYPSRIYFLLISSNIPKVILWHIYMLQLDTMNRDVYIYFCKHSPHNSDIEVIVQAISLNSPVSEPIILRFINFFNQLFYHYMFSLVEIEFPFLLRLPLSNVRWRHRKYFYLQ